MSHIAIRGDAFALSRVSAANSERFCVTEVDDAGDITYYAVGEGLDAAFDDLDSRYLATVATRSAHLTYEMLSAYNRRDWDAYAATLSPDLRTADHLLVAGKAMQSPAELVEYIQAFVELIPDIRSDIVKPILVEDDGGVALVWEHGTEAVGGGPVDIGYVSVGLIGDDGRFRWFEVYPSDQVDVAIARYRELAER